MSGGFKYVETKKVSKSQKRREAKAAKKAEQQKRFEEGEKIEEHQERNIEQDRLKAILDSCGLYIHEIDADGDCMYRAVEHQLNLAQDTDECLGFQELRNRTSKYMLEHADDFRPFLLTDDGDLMNDQQFKSYCSKIAHTKEWGGHLELTAISQFTRKPIHIFQADNRNPIKIEPREDFKKKPMLISFHKHLYHLGEHYNSLVHKTN